MTLEEIAKQLKESNESIILIYAFNSIGKTRLSVAYKDYTKGSNNGNHSGVYYNAYSEDLFVWDNDEHNEGENVKLDIIRSSLNSYHKYLNDETPIREKLKYYNPTYQFKLNPESDDPELGWKSVSFFKDTDPETLIKISRGEERIFVWCFFLALFELEGWVGVQNQHFFIDDPISSLDDNNIFITAYLIFELIEKYFEQRKVIITTHHMGFYSVLSDWLCKGENAPKFKTRITVTEQIQENGTTIIREKQEDKNKFKILFLEKDTDDVRLTGRKKGTQLYHLLLLQLLEEANNNDELMVYHFALLRQLLENVSSFLGIGRFGYVLNKIGIPENKLPDIINALSHQKIYYPKTSAMNKEEKEKFRQVFGRLKANVPFEL
jgi:hypothetical protein